MVGSSQTWPAADRKVMAGDATLATLVVSRVLGVDLGLGAEPSLTLSLLAASSFSPGETIEKATFWGAPEAARLSPA